MIHTSNNRDKNTRLPSRLQELTEPPTDLNSTAELTVTNQPIGTFVGEFNATDPEGGAVTYHFVDGDNNNSLFTLDTNGTLKTATTFDYESNASSFTIRLEAGMNTMHRWRRFYGNTAECKRTNQWFSICRYSVVGQTLPR